MDIVERLRSYAGKHVYESHSTLELAFTEAANEIERLQDEVYFDDQTINRLQGDNERLREWIRHIGYYVSRNEVDLTPTEKYIQKVCTSALTEGE